MKNPIVAFCAVIATATIAESQAQGVVTPVKEPVPLTQTATNSAAVAGVDEIDLAALPDADKRLVSVKGDGEERLVSIDCENMPLGTVLAQFGKTVNANLVFGGISNLNNTVTLSLHDAPWKEAMQIVLAAGRCRAEERNGIFFVQEEKSPATTKTKSFVLNHASACELAELLNDSFGVKGKDGKVITPVATVFKDANVVVVSDTEKVIGDCEEIVKTVDKAPPQVYIEARFIELTSEAMHNLGIKWDSLAEYRVTAKGLKAGFENNGGHAADYGEKLSSRNKSSNRSSNDNDTTSDNNNSTEGDNSSINDSGSGKTSSSSQNRTKTLSSNSNRTRSNNNTDSDNSTFNSLIPTAIGEAAGAGASAASMGWKNAYTFSGQLSADNFSLALSAFEQMQDVKMFSNPRIIVSNGKEAKVDMTTKYPNVTVQASRSSGLSEALDISTRIEVIPGEDKHMFAQEAFFSWGISLSVTPRISPDGLINVEIVPTISDRSDWARVQGNGAEDGVYSQYPVINIQRLVTDFTMKDGSTAVIGGLTRTSEEDVDSGIPYLRKIPWIGPRLFGWKSRSKVQKEIIVFVTVGVANPNKMPEDIGLPKNAVLGREYVEKRAFEPGDRGGMEKSMALDMRPLDDRKAVQPEEPAPEEPKGPEKKSDPEPEPAPAAGPQKTV